MVLIVTNDTFIHIVNGLALSSAGTNYNNIHISNMKVVLLLFAGDTVLFLCLQMVYNLCKINCKSTATFWMFLSTRKPQTLFSMRHKCYLSFHYNYSN